MSREAFALGSIGLSLLALGTSIAPHLPFADGDLQTQTAGALVFTAGWVMSYAFGLVRGAQSR